MGVKNIPDGWVTYTPTVTANSGSFTTASGTGRYVINGKTCTLTFDALITTVGTGQGLKLTLPVRSANTGAYWIGAVREVAVVGTCGVANINPNDTTLICLKYDNGAWQGNNYRFRGTITYEIA